MDILKFATKIAKQAGKFILEGSKKDFKVTLKKKNDLVTELDIATEKLLIKEILKQFPDHAIIGEESVFAKKGELEIGDYREAPYIWIIDPIDGTTNFTHKLPYYAVSIGIFKTKQSSRSKNYAYLEGELIAGVVYAPALNELYTAEKGKGAYLNGKKIQVSKVKTLERALLISDMSDFRNDPNLAYLQILRDKCQAMRRFGAATLDLCNVARGAAEGYWELNIKPWDMAAGVLIISEAGGKVTDINGNLLDLFGKNILATNGKIHKELLKDFDKL